MQVTMMVHRIENVIYSTTSMIQQILAYIVINSAMDVSMEVMVAQNHANHAYLDIIYIQIHQHALISVQLVLKSLKIHVVMARQI